MMQCDISGHIKVKKREMGLDFDSMHRRTGVFRYVDQKPFQDLSTTIVIEAQFFAFLSVVFVAKCTF